jgi:hypothetical protein
MEETMRKCLCPVIWLLTILLVCPAVAIYAELNELADIPATHLYLADIHNSNDANILSVSGAEVVLKVAGGYLVLLEPGEFDNLARAGLEVSFVASNIDRAHLAMDMRMDRKNVDRYDLVFEEGGIRLYRIDPNQIDRKSGEAGIAPLRARRIPIEYIPQKPAMSLKSSYPVDLDSLVSLVRQDSLESYSYHLESYGGRPAGSPSIASCAYWMASKFQDFGYDSIEVQMVWDSVYDEWAQLRNVIAYKTGTVNPDFYIIFGAHYDAVPGSPGADDNGSGTAAVLDIARAMVDLETNVSYAFALWDGEEEGLLGAYHYADRAGSRGDRIVINVNMDMIAHYQNDIDAQVYTNQGAYEQLLIDLADSIEAINLDFHPYGGGGTDYIPFEQNGYDFVAIHEHIFSTVYHSYLDNTAHLNFDYMTRMARSAMLIAYVVGENFVPDPELVLSSIGELPQVLYPQAQNPVVININSYGGAGVIPGSVQLHYSIDGGEWITDPMTESRSSVYTGYLPSLTCEGRLQYYITAEEYTLGTYYLPGVNSQVNACVSTGKEIILVDDFGTDKGWQVTSDAARGDWERSGVSSSSFGGAPGSDHDGNRYCYLTDDGYGQDVDAGSTTLTSPSLDASAGPALLHYARWYSNHTGSAPFSDVMTVQISNNNGSTWTLVETVGPEDQASGGWYSKKFWIDDLISSTDQIRVRFVASDNGDDSQIEAGIDDFSMTRFTFAPIIITGELPHWTVGVPFAQQLVAIGCAEEYTWSDKYGHLEGTNLSVSPTGLVSGIPLEPGLILFAAEALDDLGEGDERMYSFMINPILIIETENLPGAVSGLPYDCVMMADGGTGSKSWTDRDNILDGSGLAVTSDGHITGTPVDTGVFNVVVRVEDEVGGWAEAEFVLNIGPDYDCGDANGDRLANIADAVFIINFVFKSGPAPEPIQSGDANCDGETNVGDAVYMINYVFKGGPGPCCP